MITLDSLDDCEFKEPIFVEKFDESEPYNEKEEDITNLDKLNVSSMAITGTDWTAETLVSQIKKGNIVLNPDFQRRDAWTIKTKSRFIESLLLGLPIPQIILAEQQGKRGSYIVIDGKQRLLALQQFVLGNESGEKIKLTGLEVKTQFNRKTYDDILSGPDNEEIDAFNNQTIRTVVIKNWPSPEVLYLLFLRLNTGSVKLSPQELRQALYPGSFIKFVNEESAKCEELQQMLNLKGPDFRMRDVEILIRYFAFKYYLSEYGGSLQAFLDKTCNNLNQKWEACEATIQDDFRQMKEAIITTREIFGSSCAFKKYKNEKYEDKYNRAVIDIMLYYFSANDWRNAARLKKAEIKQAFEQLCANNPSFLTSIETTTKSLAAVQCRFLEWGKTLNKVLGTDFALPTWVK